MSDRQWWVAGDAEASGPFSTDEIRARIAGGGEAPCYVWADGMAEWAEAAGLPEFAPGAPATAIEAGPAGEPAPAARPGLKERLRREMVEYALIAAYLYVALGALILFKASIMKSDGVVWSHYGLAVIKALILAKFILLLQYAPIGARRETLYLRVLQKGAVFVVLLFALNLAEEFLVGRLHGKSWTEIAGDMSTLLSQPVIVAFLMFLILLPYFAVLELSEYFGEGRMRAAMLSRRGGAAG